MSIHSRLRTLTDRHTRAVSAVNLWLSDIPRDRQLLNEIIAEWALLSRKEIMRAPQSIRDSRQSSEVLP